MKSKKMIAAIGAVLIVSVAIIAGYLYKDNLFSPSAKADQLAIDTNATSESVSSLVDYMNMFSFDLYTQLSNDQEHEGKNIFFSPYSVFVALSMTYEGAKNETAADMQEVLYFPQNNDTMLCSFGRLYNIYNFHKNYTLETANALWTQHDFSFLDSYLDFIEHYYMGRATEVDFSQAEETAEQINNWIEEKTHDKIQDMLSSEDIDPATKMILTNAIYFKGDWLYQFDPEDTVDKDFFVSNEETVTVPMMQLDDDDISFNYTETDDFQMLELPYDGNNVSMIVLLPKENNISTIEQQISWENISDWEQTFQEKQVKVILPKFEMETTYNLGQHLIEMGMQIPFTTNADFSGMDGRRDLFIGKVLHNAFVKVDETGTEAAAATTVHMELTAIPPSDQLVFNADHPFLFFIQHKQTNNILFMGKITNPE
ncbi:MAG: serpin family protein [Thermoplasmatota archaeon]